MSNRPQLSWGVRWPQVSRTRLHSAERSWRWGLFVLAATLAGVVAWYFARVRGAGELPLAFGLMIGAAIALVGFVLAGALMWKALVGGMPWTRGRIAVAGVVGVGIFTSAAVFVLLTG